MNFESKAGRRRLRSATLGIAVSATFVAAGCGEKSEPAVHPPTTATPTVTAPTTPVPGTTPTQPRPSAPTTTAPKAPQP